MAAAISCDGRWSKRKMLDHIDKLLYEVLPEERVFIVQPIFVTAPNTSHGLSPKL
jgi:hypothetical protein